MSARCLTDVLNVGGRVLANLCAGPAEALLDDRHVLLGFAISFALLSLPRLSRARPARAGAAYASPFTHLIIQSMPSKRPSTGASRPPLPRLPTALLLLLSTATQAAASLPQVDFSRMGTVGLAGAFAGLDVFDPAVPALDPAAATLLARAANGSFSRLAATNDGGALSATCTLADTVYFAGTFSSLGGASASNVAAYTPSSGAFAALGSGGPDGPVAALYCDGANNRLWAAGRFTHPAPGVAVWDAKGQAWAAPPFGGLGGAVLAIAPGTGGSSLLFGGAFVTGFAGAGAGANGTTAPLNHTNNPNVPFSAGASPFSSSLVPVPFGPGAQVVASPSSTDAGFADIHAALCPAGADGPGNTWLSGGQQTAQVTARAFSALSAGGVRLGNTFVNGRGTTQFRFAARLPLRVRGTDRAHAA
jgi:hypothetical protein